MFHQTVRDSSRFETGGLILSMNGQPVGDSASLRIQLSESAPGTSFQ